MSDKKRPKATSTQKRKDRAKELRDQTIITQAASGKPVNKIALDMGVHRSVVSRVLSGEETKEIIEQGQSQLTELVLEAIQVTKRALADVDLDLAFNAATKVLKSVGIMKDKVEMSHTFPKPTVIKKRDGSSVVLGTEEEE